VFDVGNKREPKPHRTTRRQRFVMKASLALPPMPKSGLRTADVVSSTDRPSMATFPLYYHLIPSTLSRCQDSWKALQCRNRPNWQSLPPAQGHPQLEGHTDAAIKRCMHAPFIHKVDCALLQCLSLFFLCRQSLGTRHLPSLCVDKFKKRPLMRNQAWRGG